MNNLKFSHNWNGKLYANTYFTTMRLWNERKYVIGENFEVYLGNEYLGVAQLRAVRRTTRAKLNEFVCGLDTGYAVAPTQQIIGRMYKKKADDPLGLYLFCWVKKEPACSVNVPALLERLKKATDA